MNLHLNNLLFKKKRIISELHKNACVLISIDTSMTWVTNLGMSTFILRVFFIKLSDR